MGGRGASSGISEKGKPYGSEYRTVLKSGNIKFVVKTNGSSSAPMETMTKGRVYVTVNGKKNFPQFISYYDAKNKKAKTIDLTHPHNGEQPHVHHGANHNENDGPKGGTRLTPEEKKMVARIMNLWYNRNNRK